MPRAMQVITGFVTAPGATLTAWVMAAGDSLSIANGAVGSNIALLNFWAQNQAAGILRVRSPLMHDNTNGIQERVVASQIYPLMAYADGQDMFPNDLLQVHQSGSAVGGQIESGSLLMYYDDLNGSDAKLRTWAQIQPRIKAYMTVTNTITAGAAGGYSGSQVLTTTDSQQKALQDYALLGYDVSVDCCTVGYTGPGTANRRVGGPGHSTNKMLTANWFIWVSNYSGKPCIPVFNAADFPTYTVDVVQNQAAAAVVVSSHFAWIGGPGSV
jgi:hypothetical protein